MVRYNEYLNCLKVYYQDEKTKNGYRLGQYLMNKLEPSQACPEIYYETEDQKAHDLFFDQFVDGSSLG